MFRNCLELLRICTCRSWFLCRLVHCVESVRIRSYSGPYFPAFGLNTERYCASLRIQSECGKIQTRITPNTDTFYAVVVFKKSNTICETSPSLGLMKKFF